MKPLKNIFLFISTLLLSMYGISQSIPDNFYGYPGSGGCGLSELTKKPNNNKVGNCPDLSPLYSNLSWYRPDNTTPTKYIRLNFIFLQKNNGTGGFQQNDPVHQQYWTDIIQALNDKFNNLVQPTNFCTVGNYSECYSNDFINNSKIQFIVNRIYIQDSFGWDNTGTWGNYLCPDNSSWYLNYLDNQIRSNSNIEPALNVFFTEEANYYNEVVNNNNCSASPALNLNCSMLPNYNDVNSPIKVHIRNSYTSYRWANDCAPAIFGYPYDPIIRGWGISGTAGSLAHEIGHCFFSTVNHCNSCIPNPPIDKCRDFPNYQIMNQCGVSPRNYLATQNIENIHRTLALTNMRRFVDNCTTSSELLISNNEFIDFDVKLYRDLKILPNNTLDLDCRMVVLENATINIEQSATMNINNDGIIDVDCNSCLGINFNVSGNLNINNTQFNLPVNATLSINSSGVVNINSSSGLCVNQGGQINIASGGKLYINGQDYTNILTNGYNNVYDKFFSNQPILGGTYYALNKIETSSTVNTLPGQTTELIAGRQIIFKPGFSGFDGLHASIDPYINNCGETPCINQGSHLRVNNTPNETESFKDYSLNKSTNLYQIKIFPNPNSGVFTLNISATNENLTPIKDNEQFYITIINAMGKKVFEKQINTLHNDLDITNLSKGLYHVNVVAVNSNTKIAEAMIIR